VRTIAADECIYDMDRKHPPVAAVRPGEVFRVLTKDCYSNTVRTEKDTFRREDWRVVNPATGPVEVQGARPGQVLVVHVLDLVPKGPGTMVQQTGVGAIRHRLRRTLTRKIPVRGGVAGFSRRVSLKTSPMIGVIGTAPRRGSVPTGTPGPHGGNMDCPLIGRGAKVYLPVEVPGAMLALGDVHALQGDGEVLICALECRAEVKLKVSLLDDASIPLPMVENRRVVAPMYSAKTLEACERGVIAAAWDYLLARGVPEDEAGFLMSLCGSLRVNQVVDPLKTMRFEFPKAVLAAYSS
jgi:amidase